MIQILILRSSRAGLRHTPHWRLSRAPLVAGLAISALLGLGLVFAERAEASSCAGPLAAGEIRVVLVVDGSDLGKGSSATCLVVPAGTTGSQLLARRGSELGTGPPRYGSSGLLCAIDGAPALGCGDRSAGGFAYWAYFNGSSGSWTYGTINPFIKRLVDGDIEGWRYVQGAGNGQDPPPQLSPSRSLFPELITEVALPPAPLAPASSAPTTSTTVSEQVAVEIPTTSAAVVITEETVVVGDVALASATSESSAGQWFGIFGGAIITLALAGGAWARTRRSQ
ncbi:MAG: hypothetical protein WEA11_05675 [Acidimicrobiales bacterium]